MGPFGFGNLGDAAIQQAMIQHIRRRFSDRSTGEAEIVGFSLNPDDTTYRHGIRAYPIGRMALNGWESGGSAAAGFRVLRNRFHNHRISWIRLIGKLIFGLPAELVGIAAAYRYIKGFSVLYVSGGGQLDDYWGGPFYHPYTLWLWGLLCRLARVKYRFVSVGAGPLDHRPSAWFVRQALALADYRSFRDEYSRQFIAQRGFFRNDPVYPDLAHSLPVQAYLAAPRRTMQAPVVGIGPMAYYDPRVWPKKDQAVYMGYLGKLAEFIIWLSERAYQVVLFPGEAVHDRDVIADLAGLLQERGLSPGERLCIPTIESVDELMGVLAGVDLVAASRFHGVLLPMLLSKPVLAVSYHEKVDELMKDAGQEQYCLPIDTFDIETMKERFASLEACQGTIREQIRACVERYRGALDEQYERIFSGI